MVLSEFKELFKTLSHGEIEVSMPTLQSQQEIWASIQFDPKASLCYNESITVTLKGELKTSLLKESLSVFLKRHDAFRSCFSPDGRQMIVYRGLEVNFNYQNLSEDHQKTDKLSLLEKMATQIEFDLVQGPLYFFQLLKMNENDHRLIITAHHLICDGWSMAVLVNEVSQIYECLLGRKEKLEEANQLIDFILPFNRSAKTNEMAYWKSELAGAPSNIKLPIDFERPEFRSYESDRIDYKLKEELVFDLQGVAAKNRLSFYQVLFSAFKVFLAKTSGQNDLVVGISSALQSSQGKFDLVGHLVQLLPIRSKIEEVSFLDYAQNVKSKMLSAIDHSAVTFGEIIKEIDCERDPALIPLINVIFNVDQQYPDQGFEFKNIEASYYSNPRSFENFEIFINATTLAQNCVLECQYNTNLYQRETIQRWMVEFENTLQELIEAPDQILVVEQKMPTNSLSSKRESVDLIQGQTSGEVDTSSENYQIVLKLWGELLGIDELKSDSNFFSLGGHSLLAMDLSHKLKRQYQIHLSVKDIMLNPTLGEQVLLVQKSNINNSVKISEPTIEVEQGKVGEEFTLSLSQKQSWFLQQLNPSSSIFNVPSAIRIHSKLDIKRLKKAYKKILELHPQLRVTFVKGPKQKILSTEEVINELDFNIHSKDLDSAIEEMNQEAETAKNLGTNCLFTLKIYQVEPEQFVLYNNFHHINFDGWSFDLFFDHLNKAYSGEAIAPEQRSYQAFILEQERKLESSEFKLRVGEFSKKFLDHPSFHYPADHERPDVMSHEAKTLSFIFDEEKKRRFTEFSRTRGISLFNLFLGAFSKALMKGMQKSEIVIGTPLRARPDIRDRGTIGYFVNSLPVIVSDIPSSDLFLNNTQKELLVTLENEDIPLECLIRELSIKRDQSQTALFQQLFSFQEVSNREGVFDHRPYSQVNIQKSSTHTDIDMWIKASDKKIEGAIEYRKDLYREETIKKLLSDFYQVLDELIDELIEDNNERTDGNVEGLEIPVFRAVENFAVKTPNAPALRVGETSLSYFELNSMINQKAEYFQTNGVKSGDLVGVCSHRDHHMVASLLGLMKIGATYIPLDPYFPEERLDYMIEHSGLRTILNHSGISKQVRDPSIISLAIDKDTSELSGRYSEGYSESNSMYVIYTSGSTGKPKGVEVGFRSVNNFLASMQKILGTNRNTNLLAITTLSFDISVLELYLPLYSGGMLTLADKFQAIDGAELKNLIQKNKINTIQGTPASFRLLLNSEFEDFNGMNIICGGEAFPIDLAQKLLEKKANVWNAYGPTETTVWSLIKKFERPLERISIGNPIAQTTVHLLDESLEEVESGEVGELCIGGVGLAKGYFRDTGKTNESFIRHPKFGRIYKTGDLARQLESGEFECLGRNDSQVKIRGYRIELGEIENALVVYPKIAEVAVLVKEYSKTDKRLVAHYSAIEKIDEKELRSFLSKTLPSYMIPNHFLFKKKLPLTPNGKINRKALNEENTEVAFDDRSNTSARSKLANIWHELLGQSVQDDSDNFFEAGGHSLLAVDLFSRLEKEFKIDLNLSELINKASFGEILELVAPNAETKENFECLVPIRVLSGSKNLFCVHGVGGNILNYLSLKESTAEYSLIGIQAYGVNGDLNLPGSIKEMSLRYVEEILRFQSRGPFTLAGGSMGGTIALEVARELQNRGHKVESIIMFDTFGPNLEIKERKKIDLSKRISESLLWRMRKLADFCVSSIYRKLKLKLPHKFRYRHIELMNYKLLFSHSPKPYKGRVDLIRAPQISGLSYADPYLGWKGILDTSKLRCYEIQGTHENIVESSELPGKVHDILRNLSS